MSSTSLEDFKIEKILGKGSFSSVYLVTRKKDNKIYALKSVILEQLPQKQQESSVNEVRILASINHPNVIGYKEAFWDEKSSSLNIVMEYADDGDLQTKINKMKNENGFFKESIIWHYSIQMIQGLKSLHDKKIMHRDIKSANIFLIKEKHQCKLGDLNVSKVIKEKLLRTQTGTPYYASPEVWRDKPYSYKSDLWSIGCVIYELCELKPPFSGINIDELFINVCRGKFKRINKVYSDDLWMMINMLLQVDVDKRVDCDQFLNSELIVKKIEEIKKNDTFSDFNFFEKKNNIRYDEGKLLDTINFKNVNEIKSKLPTKKNYDQINDEILNQNLNNFFENKNEQINNNEKITYNNKIIDEKENKENKKNKNKLLIKEIRKELEYMKYKEELRKKEKRENFEKKIKNEKNIREKNIIKQKIKLCEKKLQEEKDKKSLILNIISNKKKRIIIPMNFNKKKKFLKRRQLNNLYQNNSILPLLTNVYSSKDSIINNYFDQNKTSIKNNPSNKNFNFFEIKIKSHSPSLINNNNYQSFSTIKKYKKNSYIPLNKNQHKASMLIINTNNLNINTKNSINFKELKTNKTSKLNFYISNNSNNSQNYSNRNYKKKYSLNKKKFNSIINLKEINNNLGVKDSYKSGVVYTTPDVEKINPISKLISHRKKDSEKRNLNINFNIHNNYQRYLNNRYNSGENLKTFENQSKMSIDKSSNIKRKYNKFIKESSLQNYFSLNSKINKNKNNINLLNNKINKSVYQYLKLNIPIKKITIRKMSEINLDSNIYKVKNNLKKNKIKFSEKFELSRPEITSYDLNKNNIDNINNNILLNRRNNYIKTYNNKNIINICKKDSFLYRIKKFAIDKLLDGNRSNRINDKFIECNKKKYSFLKKRDTFTSLNHYNENSCLNIQFKTKNFLL